MAMSKECSINLKEHIIDLSQVSHFDFKADQDCFYHGKK